MSYRFYKYTYVIEGKEGGPQEGFFHTETAVDPEDLKRDAAYMTDISSSSIMILSWFEIPQHVFENLTGDPFVP